MAISLATRPEACEDYIPRTWSASYLFGHNGINIRPKERRVLRLPVVALGNGDKVETVVLLWYTTSDESGEKSSLEVE
jgi:hypothetical protein